ncbi:VOC family protein [Saccharopolyspora pogona]|uniref:VOC family protein n=1 Tax=Saccharopolyspora pogona TaxID=333966 RepID=UPI0021DF7F32|nr:VOC family protein [Saccharopolyspora pogona]
MTFDAHDPARLAEFWAVALDYVQQSPPPGFESWEQFAQRIGLPEEKWDAFAAVMDPEGKGPRVFFQKVPEGKTAKNRVHLDINVSQRGLALDKTAERRQIVAEHVDQLKAVGATFVREVDEPNGYCIVLLDPEGNEFCVH